jgi:hypothetical protein
MDSWQETHIKFQFTAVSEAAVLVLLTGDSPGGRFLKLAIQVTSQEVLWPSDTNVIASTLLILPPARLVQPWKAAVILLVSLEREFLLFRMFVVKGGSVRQ